jgi:FAD/FMN-containing dehydrogenase
MERMNRILAFDGLDRTLRVEAGVVTEAVQATARSHSLYYPVDFGSRGSSQIGGNVATNAGGIKVLRYGMTRDWVTGLKVVTGTGDLLDLNRGLTKNASGYDLRHLFIGCEGTLGFVVEATLQLTAPPPEQQVMVLALADMSALMSVFASLRENLNLSAFEFFDDRALAHVVEHGARRPFDGAAACYVLAEFDADQERALAAFQTGVDAGWIREGVVSQSHAQSTDLWRLREGITESLSRFHRTRTTSPSGYRLCRPSWKRPSGCLRANILRMKSSGSATSATETCTSAS